MSVSGGGEERGEKLMIPVLGYACRLIRAGADGSCGWPPATRLLSVAALLLCVTVLCLPGAATAL